MLPPPRELRRRLRRERQDRLPTQDPALGAGGDLQDPPGLYRRDGGVPERSFRRPHVAQSQARAPHHSGEVRQAFRG